jgi:co-chaperonin GroES (HSP10)
MTWKAVGKFLLVEIEKPQKQEQSSTGLINVIKEVKNLDEGVVISVGAEITEVEKDDFVKLYPAAGGGVVVFEDDEKKVVNVSIGDILAVRKD